MIQNYYTIYKYLSVPTESFGNWSILKIDWLYINIELNLRSGTCLTHFIFRLQYWVSVFGQCLYSNFLRSFPRVRYFLCRLFLLQTIFEVVVFFNNFEKGFNLLKSHKIQYAFIGRGEDKSTAGILADRTFWWASPPRSHHGSVFLWKLSNTNERSEAKVIVKRVTRPGRLWRNARSSPLSPPSHHNKHSHSLKRKCAHFHWTGPSEIFVLLP